MNIDCKMKKQFSCDIEWKNVDSVDQRSDCMFCTVWSWPTLSIKASFFVISKERVNDLEGIKAL